MAIIDNILFTQTAGDANTPLGDSTYNHPTQHQNINNELNSIEDTLVQGYVRESASVSYVSSSSFTVSGDVTAIYTPGRIVRFSDGTTGIVSSSSYSSPNTTVTMLTGTVPSSLSYVDIAIQAKGQTSGLASRVLGDNNIPVVSQKDNTNTARSVAKVNSSNVLEVGDSNLAGIQFNTPYSDLSSIYRQAIINGNFDVWQRGTSFTSNSIYTADRWKYYDTGSSRTVTRDTDVPNTSSLYSIKTVCSTGGTNKVVTFTQNIEGSIAGRFSGKKVTVSFYIKASAGSGSLNNGLISIHYPSALDNFTTIEYVTGTSFTPTTSWQLVTATFTLPATSTSGYSIANGFSVGIQAGCTDNTTLTVRLAQVQLCAGEVALPFQPKSFNEELRACLRYFYNPLYNVTSNYPPVCPVYVLSSTYGLGRINFPLPMRTTPTLSVGTISSFNIGYPAPNVTCSNITLHADGKTPIYCILELSFTGATAGLTQSLYRNNNSSAYIYFDAEL